MTDENPPLPEKPAFRLDHWLQDRALRGLIWCLLRLPYTMRVPLCGWVMAQIIAPIAGYRSRVRDNLALILPDLPQAEVQRLTRAVPDNVGRTVIEIYSGAEFIARAMRSPLNGAGVAALDDAHAAGRPVILVTGHFGNYDASRAALIARGYRVGALYRPMDNTYFNAHYVAAISRIGTPLFPRGRRGLARYGAASALGRDAGHADRPAYEPWRAAVVLWPRRADRAVSRRTGAEIRRASGADLCHPRAKTGWISISSSKHRSRPAAPEDDDPGPERQP